MATRTAVAQGERTRQRILAAFEARRSTRVPPTYAEIAGDVGVSVTAVRQHIDRLIDEGKLVRLPHAHRNVVLPEES